MAYTNQMKVWASSGGTSTASSALTYFASGETIQSNIFNGILKDVSLVTVSLIAALQDCSTDTSTGTINNTMTKTTMTTAIKNLLKKLSITNLTASGTISGSVDIGSGSLTVNSSGTITSNGIFTHSTGAFTVNATATMAAINASGIVTLSDDTAPTSSSTNAALKLTAGGIYAASNIRTANDVFAKNITATTKVTVKKTSITTSASSTYTLSLPEANGTIARKEDIEALDYSSGSGIVSAITQTDGLVNATIKHLYLHCIRCYTSASSSADVFDVRFNIISTDDHQISGTSETVCAIAGDIKSHFNNYIGNRFLASGVITKRSNNTPYKIDSVSIANSNPNGVIVNFYYTYPDNPTSPVAGQGVYFSTSTQTYPILAWTDSVITIL